MYCRKTCLAKATVAFWLLSISLAAAQRPGTPPEHLKKFTPPDGLWLGGNLFIDKTEIANIHWLEYLHYVEKDSSLEMKEDAESLAPYLGWDNIGAKAYLARYASLRKASVRPVTGKQLASDFSGTEYNGAVIQNQTFYGSSEMYWYFPAVGVSYEQAQNYSRWRSASASKSVNERLIAQGSDQRVLYKFRLPSPEEWEKAAKTLPLLAEYRIDTVQRALPKSLYRFIRKKNPDAISRKEFKQLKAPYFVCDFRLPSFHEDSLLFCEGYNFLGDIHFDNAMGYHFLGNVAEMTSVPGLAKGGSWMHKQNECTVENNIAYGCPSEWLGFRNVCELFVYHKDSIPPAIAHDVSSAPDTGCALFDKKREDLQAWRLVRSPETQAEALGKFLEKYQNFTQYCNVNIKSEALEADSSINTPKGYDYIAISFQIEWDEYNGVSIDTILAWKISYKGLPLTGYQFIQPQESIPKTTMKTTVRQGFPYAFFITIVGTKDGRRFEEYYSTNIP